MDISKPELSSSRLLAESVSVPPLPPASDNVTPPSIQISTSTRSARDHPTSSSSSLESSKQQRLDVYNSTEDYHYYRLFQQLPEASLLQDMQLWPNTKEITESMACLVAIEKYILPFLQRKDVNSTTTIVSTNTSTHGNHSFLSSPSDTILTPSPPSLALSCPRKNTIVVVGDGGRPRTGALLAMILGSSSSRKNNDDWQIISVDPELIYDSILDCTFDSLNKRHSQYEGKIQEAIRLWKNIPNLQCIRGRIQDIRIFSKQTIIVMMHAHVNFLTTLPSIDTSEGVVGLVTVPCCNWINEHSRLFNRLPDQEYTDPYLLSEKNLVRVWYQPPYSFLGYDPLYIFQNNIEKFLSYRNHLLKWDIQHWYRYPVYKTEVDELDINHQALASWTTNHAKCVQKRDGLQHTIHNDTLTMLYGNNGSNNNSNLCLLPSDIAIIVRELAFPSISSVPIRLLSLSSNPVGNNSTDRSNTDTVTAKNVTYGNRICTIGVVKSVRILKSIIFLSLEDLPSPVFQSSNVITYMEQILPETAEEKRTKVATDSSVASDNTDNNKYVNDCSTIPPPSLDPKNNHLFTFSTIQDRIAKANTSSFPSTTDSQNTRQDSFPSLVPLWSAIERGVHFEHTAGKDKRPVQSSTASTAKNDSKRINDDENNENRLYQLQFCASRVSGYDEKIRPKLEITKNHEKYTSNDNDSNTDGSHLVPLVKDNESSNPNPSSVGSKSFIFPRLDSSCIEWLPHVRAGDIVLLEGIIGPIVEKYNNVLVYIEKALLLYNSIIRVSSGQVRLINH